MNMHKALITGTTGLVGSRIFETLWEKTGWDITGISRSKGAYTDTCLDLSLPGTTDTLKSIGNYDVIIHTAALTKTEVCEKNPETCYSANVTATQNLAEAFPHAKFIFFSTYAVYNTPEGNCNEDCAISPTNHYIRTKMEAENSIIHQHKDFVILRPSVIFGYLKFERESKNYFMQLLDNVKDKRVTRSPVDQYFNPIHVDVIADLVYLLIIRKTHGIFNIGCNEPVSKYSFNRMVMDRFGFDTTLLEGVESKTLSVARPNNGTVSSEKIQNTLQFRIPPLRDMIEDLYESASDIPSSVQEKLN